MTESTHLPQPRCQTMRQESTSKNPVNHMPCKIAVWSKLNGQPTRAAVNSVVRHEGLALSWTILRLCSGVSDDLLRKATIWMLLARQASYTLSFCKVGEAR